MSAATGEPVDLDAIRAALAKVGSSCNHLGCDNPDCAWHRGPEWLAALLAEVARLQAALAAAEGALEDARARLALISGWLATEDALDPIAKALILRGTAEEFDYARMHELLYPRATP